MARSRRQIWVSKAKSMKTMLDCIAVDLEVNGSKGQASKDLEMVGNDILRMAKDIPAGRADGFEADILAFRASVARRRKAQMKAKKEGQ